MWKRENTTSPIPIISCRARHPLSLFLLGVAAGALLSASLRFWLMSP